MAIKTNRVIVHLWTRRHRANWKAVAIFTNGLSIYHDFLPAAVAAAAAACLPVFLSE